MKLVVIGGGTGSFAVLQSLKSLTPDISAVVNMCDDGGSTGLLRDELGVLPPGDARQCLVALSEAPEMRELFNYRFAKGGLAGHSLGNIIISGLELQQGSFEQAIETASRILRIRGQVLPAALGEHKLAMCDGDEEILGQYACEIHAIEHADARIRLVPASPINPKANEAIRQADMVVIAPGAFYTSILPIFSVDGIAEALAASRARVIFMANLVNKAIQTKGWHVVDYLKHLEEYIGPGQIDTVLYNIEPLPPKLLKKYAADGDYPVLVSSERFSEISVQPVGAPLFSKEIRTQNPADKLIQRNYLRHDSEKVKAAIQQIYEEYIR